MKHSKKLVLVGVVNRHKDLEIARKKHWYRIPIRHAPKRKAEYLALYQTRVFRKQGKAINYYACIRDSCLRKRSELLPEEQPHPRSEDYYYKLNLGTLKRTRYRIENRYWRRVAFAFTTLEKLLKAKEISQLFDIVPIEEIMRQSLMACGIKTSSQYSVIHNKRLRYRLDFAIFCRKGKINIECDNPRWHLKPCQRRKDKKRDQCLKRHGWTILRFNTEQIKNNTPTCVKILKQKIRKLGGQ